MSGLAPDNSFERTNGLRPPGAELEIHEVPEANAMNFASRWVLQVVVVLLALSDPHKLVAQEAPPRDTPEASRAEWLARSPFKEAPPPSGAALHGGGGSSGAEYDEWNQRIETGLAPSEVLEHYRSVFRERGWTIGAVVVDGSVAMATGHTAAHTGDQHVVIMAAKSVVEPDRVVLMLRLTRLVQP